LKASLPFDDRLTVLTSASICPARLTNATLSIVSTVQEIEAAIEQLPIDERDVLESRMLARRCGLTGLSQDEEKALVASLDEAEREIDSGRQLSGDQLRDELHSWTVK